MRIICTLSTPQGSARTGGAREAPALGGGAGAARAAARPGRPGGRHQHACAHRCAGQTAAGTGTGSHDGGVARHESGFLLRRVPDLIRDLRAAPLGPRLGGRGGSGTP